MAKLSVKALEKRVKMLERTNETINDERLRQLGRITELEFMKKNDEKVRVAIGGNEKIYCDLWLEGKEHVTHLLSYHTGHTVSCNKRKNSDCACGAIQSRIRAEKFLKSFK